MLKNGVKRIMKKNEVLKELIENYNTFEKQQIKIIKPLLDEESIKKYNFKIVEKKADLSKDINSTVGFYMIFSSVKPRSSVCKLMLEVDDETFYCVYRGHSCKMKDRLISHLFYDPNGKYENCMKVLIDDNKYNINIETKTIYDNKQVNENVVFPDNKWLVKTIVLSNTKQGIREIFEMTFDELYNKPPYSDK